MMKLEADDLRVAVDGLTELGNRADQWAGHYKRTKRPNDEARARVAAEQYRRAATWLDTVVANKKRGTL